MFYAQNNMMFAAANFGVWGALGDILLLLIVAFVFGIIAVRLKQSVIVGYLIAGTLVGPNVLALISEQEQIFNIAELGVALLLFLIGLEFSPKRLLELGKNVLLTGVFQVVITTLIGWAVARACHLDNQESLVIGMMIAMSSTACVLRLLSERGELESLHGRPALGILLVQDIAIVPMMLIANAMVGDQSPTDIAIKISLSILLAGGMIAVFYFVFSILLPKLFKFHTWQRNRDLPILLGMILALGSAWVAHQFKLSPALGAFAGGVLLAVSPFATQIRADVRPLSTVLVTLFFASIGMFGDPYWLYQNWVLVIGIVALILFGKPLIIAVIARCLKQRWRYGVATGLCLAQIGEFSFVLATIAHTEVDGVSLISDATFRAIVSASIISLLLTPYLVQLAPRFGAGFADFLSRMMPAISSEVQNSSVDSSEKTEDDQLVIIIGFGPAGQRVAEGMLNPSNIRICAIDINPSNLEVATRYGLHAVIGDATQLEVLEHAGVHQAALIVLVLPDHTTTRELIHSVRDLAPKASIIARCRYHVRHWALLTAGADVVVDEEDLLGRTLAEEGKKILAPEKDDAES